MIEASGGITLDTIAEIAATGVDYASSGALTHSAPALDVGLDIEIYLGFAVRRDERMVRHFDRVAPGARPVEAVHADLVELAHLVHP